MTFIDQLIEQENNWQMNHAENNYYLFVCLMISAHTLSLAAKRKCTVKITRHCDSVHVGFFNAVNQCDDVCHLICGHVLSFPSIHNNNKKQL